MNNRVVAHFKNKRILKGISNNFMPNKPHFHIQTLNGKTIKIELEDLKGLFFTKTYNGFPDKDESYTDTLKNAGRRIRVRFIDGEEIVGYTLGYSKLRSGFFLTPANKKSNNERIYVIASASREVNLLS